jgi:hypothetical protein
VQFSFSKCVQFTLPASAELNLAFKEEIEPPREPALCLARTLGDGLQLSMLLSQPCDDEARLSELDFSKQNRGRGVQGERDDG